MEIPSKTPPDGSGQDTNSLVFKAEDVVRDLYQRGRGADFGLTILELQPILAEVLQKNLRATDDEKAARELLESLKIEDLCLARGCAAGHEKAWEAFLLRYREPLYDMAHSISRDDGIARELADNMFADLYGTSAAEGERVSKLRSYTGVGSLAGWLRAVMARAYIDIYRKGRRTVSLEEEPELSELPATADNAATPIDRRVEETTAEVLGTLPAEDRFLLASYFLDGRTLAEVARMMGVHESTASRRVEKLTTNLRKQIRESLQRKGMSRAEAEEALEADVRDFQVDVAGRLKENLQETPQTSFPTRKVDSRAAKKGS